jgi:hypothetical protein
MRRINRFEHSISDVDRPGRCTALQRKLEYDVAAVAVTIDRDLRRTRPARRARGRNRQRIECRANDVGLPRPNLAPAQSTVTVGIQVEQHVEIAQRQIPSQIQRLAVVAEAQIGVAGLVRVGEACAANGDRHADQQAS